MGNARFPAVIFLLALLLLCACTPGGAVVDSSPTAPPAPSPIPTNTVLVQTPQPAATAEVFQGPLSVVILSPLDSALVQISPVEIKGEAEPGTVISIDDTTILVDKNRTFLVQLPLQPGTNLIEIIASDPEGKQVFAYLTLVYEP